MHLPVYTHKDWNRMQTHALGSQGTQGQLYEDSAHKMDVRHSACKEDNSNL